MTKFCPTITPRLGTRITVRSATRRGCCRIRLLELSHDSDTSTLLDPEPEARDGPPLSHSTESCGQHAPGCGGDCDGGRVPSAGRPGLLLLLLRLPPLHLLVASRSVQRLDSILLISQLAVVNIDRISDNFFPVCLAISGSHHPTAIFCQVRNNIVIPG